MSTLFDVPFHLALILALASTGASELPPEVRCEAAVEQSENPCRFSEQAWYSAVREGRGGPAVALHRDRVFRTSGGRYYVPAVAERAAVLALRSDADTAAQATFAEALAHRDALALRLGRAAEPADLYIAHAFGLDVAEATAAMAERRPDTPLAGVLQRARSHEALVSAARLNGVTVGKLRRQVRSAMAPAVARAEALLKAQALTALRTSRFDVVGEQDAAPPGGRALLPSWVALPETLPPRASRGRLADSSAQ